MPLLLDGLGMKKESLCLELGLYVRETASHRLEVRLTDVRWYAASIAVHLELGLYVREMPSGDGITSVRNVTASERNFVIFPGENWVY